MSSTTENANVVTYGKAPGFVVSWNIDEMPRETLLAFVHKGATHYYGNEAAAVLAVAKRKRAEDGLAEMTTDEQNAALLEIRNTMHERALAGKIGQSSRGPRGTAVETIMRRIARDELVAILKDAGLSFPSGKDKAGVVKTVEIAFEDGVKAYTGSQLIDAYVLEHQARLDKLAQKEVEATARAAQRTTQAGPALANRLFGAKAGTQGN